MNSTSKKWRFGFLFFLFSLLTFPFFCCFLFTYFFNLYFFYLFCHFAKTVILTISELQEHELLLHEIEIWGFIYFFLICLQFCFLFVFFYFFINFFLFYFFLTFFETLQKNK